MRYELTEYEWTAIKPMLPNKPRGVPRVNDRRVLNGILWVLRSGAPWRDLPESYGPPTTCYNRFVRWRQAGVWDRLMNALAAGHDAAVQMIDTSVVRVHQHGSCIAGNAEQHIGRSRGGLTSKISRRCGRQRFAGTPWAHARRGSRQQAMPGSPKRIASTNDATGRSRI
jgi:transposase